MLCKESALASFRKTMVSVDPDALSVLRRRPSARCTNRLLEDFTRIFCLALQTTLVLKHSVQSIYRDGASNRQGAAIPLGEWEDEPVHPTSQKDSAVVAEPDWLQPANDGRR